QLSKERRRRRNWRILFRIDEQNTVATVMAIGARGNGECYRIAERRLAAPQGPQRQSVSPVPSRSVLNRAAAENAAADEFRIIKAWFASGSTERAATRIRPRF